MDMRIDDRKGIQWTLRRGQRTGTRKGPQPPERGPPNHLWGPKRPQICGRYPDVVIFTRQPRSNAALPEVLHEDKSVENVECWQCLVWRFTRNGPRKDTSKHIRCRQPVVFDHTAQKDDPHEVIWHALARAQKPTDLGVTSSHTLDLHRNLANTL
jgi:hypothetical protein